MLLVGLTGGIGSGKSTVARLLERHGAVVIDADQLAREAVEKGGPGFERVVDAFGPSVLSSSLRFLHFLTSRLEDLPVLLLVGTRPSEEALSDLLPMLASDPAARNLDRAALAARIFSDPVQKATLEAIVHPEVARRFGESVDRYRATDRVVVYVTPLLVELGLAPAFDAVIVVTASPHLRVSRVASDRGLSPDEVRRRMAAQATDDQRAEVADVLIDNDGSLAELAPQVDRLWGDLVARAGR